MPTHAVKFAEYADKIIIMKKGRIVKSGKYSEIKDCQQFKEISIEQSSSKNKKDENEEKLIEDLKKIKIEQ